MRTNNLLWSPEFGSFIIFFFIIVGRRSNCTFVYCSQYVIVSVQWFCGCACIRDVGKTRCGRRIVHWKVQNERDVTNLVCSLYGRSERPRFAFQCKQITKRTFRWKCGKKSSQRLRLKNRLNIFLFVFCPSLALARALSLFPSTSFVHVSTQCLMQCVCASK